MITKSEFYELVLNAYQVLYDFSQLRKHNLAGYLLADQPLSLKERGWQLHNILLEAIEELHPGHGAPPFSKEWRRYRLLILRYVDVLQPNAVADELAISRRQFYREHQAAIEAVGDILWDRATFDAPLPIDISPIPPTEHAEAIRQELSRMSRHDTVAHLADVVSRVIQTLEKFLDEKGITVEMSISHDIRIASVGPNLIRQVLMGGLGILLEEATDTILHISAHTDDQDVYVLFAAEAACPVDPNRLNTQLGVLHELLEFGQAEIATRMSSPTQLTGIDLRIPIDYECKVLIVDDNQDTLALYKRFLTPNRYRVLTTTNAQAVVDLARDTLPDIIVLDLMMPELDGWELLQELANHTETSAIPIMICSVLRQQQLALAMGANAFLEKPFTEQSLLQTLERLKHEVR